MRVWEGVKCIMIQSLLKVPCVTLPIKGGLWKVLHLILSIKGSLPDFANYRCSAWILAIIEVCYITGGFNTDF